MAIPNLKTQLKKSLKKEIENEQNGGRDNRFLNYFDMKSNEKMTILFVPDVNGEFWTKFSKHGPNVTTGEGKNRRGVRGVGSVNCAYKSSGETCPACQKGFDLLNLSKETGDENFKEEAKKWFSKDYTLVSCIVLESPIDITASDDGNQVKLLYLPHNIEKIIKEAVTEEQVPEDELCSTPFVIKKTTNAGGRPDYSSSFFQRRTIEDGELDFLEDMVVEQFDYSNLDIVPKATTTEDVEEWLAKAEEAYEKALNGKGASSTDSTEKKKDVSPGKQSSRLDDLKNRAKKSAKDEEAEGDSADDAPAWEEEEDQSDSTPDAADSQAEEAQEEKAPSSARERLSRLKGRRS